MLRHFVAGTCPFEAPVDLDNRRRGKVTSCRYSIRNCGFAEAGGEHCPCCRCEKRKKIVDRTARRLPAVRQGGSQEKMRPEGEE